MILKHMKRSVWDIVLCIIMTFSLSTTIFSGFYVAETAVKSYVVTLVASAVLTLIMFVISYDRKSMLIGIPSLVVACGVALVIINMTTGTNIFRDKESNPFLPFILLLITGITVYLLSRSRLGNAVLFAAGTISAGLVAFLYESGQVVCLLLFLVTCVVMQMYRTYIYNILNSRTVKTAQGRSVLVSVVICLIIAGLGCGIFYGVISPMHPPKADMKLFTKYLSLEVLNKIGVATTKTIEDPQQNTNKKDDKERTAKQYDKNKNSGKNSKKDNTDKNKDEKRPDKLDNSNSSVFYAIKYNHKILFPLLIILIIILAIITAIVVKIQLRKKWLTRIKKLDSKKQIVAMYGFYLKKFSQLGVKKSPEETPYEFAERAKTYLRVFTVSDADITKLTSIFVSAQYGDEEPEQSDLDSYFGFHKEFYKNCRTYLGNFKYIIKFFII